MAEDNGKKGNIRFTVDVEVSEGFMDMAREALNQLPNMPQQWQQGMRQRFQGMSNRGQGQEKGSESYSR